MPDTLFTNARLILDGSTERTASSDVFVRGGSSRRCLQGLSIAAARLSSTSAAARSCRVSSTLTVTSRDCP